MLVLSVYQVVRLSLARNRRVAASQAATCRYHFERKKAALEKRDKTVAANSKVIREVEAKQAAQLDKAEKASQIREMRQVHWFEKFNWFISSEGYLVLSARDAQQAELLVRRCCLLGWFLLVFVISV